MRRPPVPRRPRVLAEGWGMPWWAYEVGRGGGLWSQGTMLAHIGQEWQDDAAVRACLSRAAGVLLVDVSEDGRPTLAPGVLVLDDLRAWRRAAWASPVYAYLSEDLIEELGGTAGCSLWGDNHERED